MFKSISILISIFLLLCMSQQVAAQQSNTLHIIYENDRYGFINQSGKEVIPPVYYNALPFSEGLAAVRVNGTYGYIDETGKQVIPAQFDYATPFSEGLAVVFVKGKPMYINKQGNKAFYAPFAALGSFEHGRAEVKTFTNKYGYIDKTGRMIIDTAFSAIGNFKDGLAVADGLKNRPYAIADTPSYYETGIIDTNGQFLVPYREFDEIAPFDNNGYAAVTIKKSGSDNDLRGFIDRKGKVVSLKRYPKNSWPGDYKNEGRYAITLYQGDTSDESYTSDNSYEGYMDVYGNVIMSDTNFYDVGIFTFNRAFIKDKDQRTFMINYKGQRIGTDTYDWATDFEQGVAFVRIGDDWGLIDTDGHYIIHPRYKQIGEGIVNNKYFFFSDSDYSGKELYGIADITGKVILNPILQEYNKNGFEDGMLIGRIDNRICYLNEQGKIIWQEKLSQRKTSDRFNTDAMTRGYFYVFSTLPPNEQMHYEEFDFEKNRPVKLNDKAKDFQEGISIVIKPEEKDTFYKEYEGFKIYLINNTRKNIVFNTQDNRLYMKTQALNEKGEWKDIEYLPNSWCGNSYYSVTLDKKSYWTFTAPVYSGDYKTKMRVQLRYIDPKSKKKGRRSKELTLYSNEFEGSVNPGQFWRKNAYYPQGIIDPYND